MSSEGNILMLKVATSLMAATLTVAMLTGISGCSWFSASDAPVDCNIVRTQAAAGNSDAQIASNLGAKEDKVAACHGPMGQGQSSVGIIPKNY
jgi:hypothetical protein